jgi:hypothetical protein
MGSGWARRWCVAYRRCGYGASAAKQEPLLVALLAYKSKTATTPSSKFALTGAAVVSAAQRSVAWTQR